MACQTSKVLQFKNPDSDTHMYTHRSFYCSVWTTKVVGNKKCTQRAQTSANLEDLDFGLWTPGSEA